MLKKWHPVIPRKPFYFLRHGETDFNVKMTLSGYDENTPLNSRGKKQAQDVGKLIDSLELDTICHSPLFRAKQTMQICINSSHIERVEIPSLQECSGDVWCSMTTKIMTPSVNAFYKDVMNGISQSITRPGASLVIAHGGVHWAICQLLEISDHDWNLENCGLVKFSPQEFCIWSAEKLVD